MHTANPTVEREDLKIHVRVKIATLWTVLMMLYIYADIFSLYRPGQVEEMVSGRMGPLPVTQGSLFTAAALMLIPALMIFLSLALKPNAGRWVNLILGVLYTAVNVGNLIGETWVYYIFFGIVEIAITLLIVAYAWNWRKES